MTDLLSIAAFSADQLCLSVMPGASAPDMQMDVDYVLFEGSPIVQVNNYRKVATMSRTAQILAEMRSDNADVIQTFSDSVDEVVEANGKRMRRDGVIRTGGPRYVLSTGKGRSEALVVAGTLLAGTETWSMNNAKRDHSLPRRALSMASSKGRCTPDMLASLMAFFSNPGDMAQTLLVSFLPTKVGTDQAKALLADTFVVDVIEGLGFKVPTATEAVKLVKNPSTSRTGGARRVTIYSPGVAPTVDAKRRGRPSGPKYVSYLPPTSDAITAASLLMTGPMPTYTCTDLSGVSGGNDVAHGAGHDQGIGWDGAWAKGHALSPAQAQRRNVALDAFALKTARMAAAAAE